jgi:hypothetical protein
MSENTEPAVTEPIVAPVENTGAPIELPDAFDEDKWVSRKPEAPVEPIVPVAPVTPAATAPAVPATPAANEEILEEDSFVKQHLGFENLETAKKEIEALRNAAKTPAEHKFVNEQSQKLYEAFKSGKEDDIFGYLSQKKQLEKLSKLELTKAEDAAEILKTVLQFKHKDLSKEEIDFYFNSQNPLPQKPVQKDDQTDEEYQESLSLWKQQVEQVEKKMIIEAKLAKPELAKYQSELVLPDIPQAAPTQTGPSQEELAQLQQQQAAYIQDVDKGLSELKGFNVEYKDEEVSLPLNYDITPDEKAKIKPIMESLFTDLSYLSNRWANKDGSINTKLMAEDLYILENKEKVFQKFANESAAQRLAHKIKADSNIDLNDRSAQRLHNPGDAASEVDKLAETFWDKY